MCLEARRCSSRRRSTDKTGSSVSDVSTGQRIGRYAAYAASVPHRTIGYLRAEATCLVLAVVALVGPRSTRR
eukprot:3940626-Rhodomonas_salina.5